MRKIPIKLPGEFIFLHINDDVECTTQRVGINSMDLDIMTAVFYLLIRAIDFIQILLDGFTGIRTFKVVFSYV